MSSGSSGSGLSFLSLGLPQVSGLDFEVQTGATVSRLGRCKAPHNATTEGQEAPSRAPTSQEDQP